MAEERERQFKYRWDGIWDDIREDYIAFDGSLVIGRVYRIKSTAAGGWWWASQAALEWHGTARGIAMIRDEACGAVEAEYDALVARIRAAKAKGWKPDTVV